MNERGRCLTVIRPLESGPDEDKTSKSRSIEGPGAS